MASTSWNRNNNMLLQAVVNWAIARQLPISEYRLLAESDTIAVYKGSSVSTGQEVIRAFIAVDGVAQGLQNTLVKDTSRFVNGAMEARVAVITVEGGHEIHLAVIEPDVYELVKAK